LVAADLFITVHLTVDQDDESELEKILERLAEAGVKQLSLSAAEGLDQQDLRLMALRSEAGSLGMSLVWNVPVPYSARNPVALELNRQDLETSPQGAGHAWLYVEPDGDVLPGQGINRVLGNLLTDPWDKIWFAARSM
jgi:MoaA/NifB/PqqE/SkfB family radical SAM enzyme